MGTRWLKKPNFSVSLESEPRKLYPEEIDAILNRLPKIRGAVSQFYTYIESGKPVERPEASEAATTNVKARVRYFLSKIKIAPAAIPELAQNILKKYERSMVVPESAVGITAAEAVGRATTQTVLNTFHISGSSKNASSGLDGMKEMIGASRKRKHTSCSIVFTDKTLGYLDVLKKRRDLVGITVGRLITDWDIDTPDQLEQFSWHKMYPLVTGKTIPKASYVMRLYLDVNVIYQHRITMERICQTIEREKAVCVYSPLPFIYQGRHTAIIDVYPVETVISEILSKRHFSTMDKPSLIFLEAILKPALNSLVIQGIPGISGLFPVPRPVLKVIREEMRTFDESSPQILNAKSEGERQRLRKIWNLIYDRAQMRLTGIKPEEIAGGVGTGIGKDKFRVPNLQKLFAVLGMNVHLWSPTHATVEVPTSIELKFKNIIEEVIEPGKAVEGKASQGMIQKLLEEAKIQVQEIRADSVILSSENLSAMAFIRKAVQIAELIEAENYSRNRKKGILLQPLNDPVIAAGRYYTADTNGTNLQELLSREDIDPMYTYSNDFHEMTRVLGVDAAKNYYIYELNRIIVEADTYVEARHILLIAEFVFNQGRPLGLTYAGISRQPNGYMSLASFQRSVDTFARAALYGRTDKMLDTSAAICVGKRIGIGTGAMELRLTKEAQKKFDLELSKVDKIDPNLLENAIQAFDQQVTGGQPLKYQGEYDEDINKFLPKEEPKAEELKAEELKAEELKARGPEVPKEITFRNIQKPATSEPLIAKAPTIPENIIELSKMLQNIPAYPNAATVQLKIGPLPRGFKSEPQKLQGLQVPPTVPIQTPVPLPFKLPRVTFVEPHVMQQIVEKPSVKLISVRDEDLL